MNRKFLNNRKTFFRALLSLGLVLLLSGSLWLMNTFKANAAIPKIINFQGKLTKVSDGTNVTNGNYSMQFKIYDASSSGNLLWTETWDGTSGTSQVAVTSGIFNVKLGTYTSLSGVDFSSGNLYLTVNFNPGAGYDGEMSPRKQLTAAAFAFNSNSLVGDGKISTVYTSTTSSAASITYNPASSTSTPAVVVTGGANLTGTVLQVTQGGTGYAATLVGGNVGIGTTTPSATLFIQGTGSVNPFVVASSTGAALLTVAPNGSTTIASLVAGPVKSAAGGSLYNGAINLSAGSSDITGILTSTNGGIGTSTLGTLSVGSGLSISGGQNVLIGTSTTISLASGVISNVATGTSGNIFNIATSTNSLTINLPLASISNTGQLQAADWTTFNNKLSGSLSANQILYATGATSTAGSNNFIWNPTSNTHTITGTTTISNWLGIGTLSQGAPFGTSTLLAIKGTTNNFIESNIQNTSSGTVASSDYILTADNGSANSYYTDLFQNSSNFINTGGISGGGNDSGLFNSDNSLYLGTASTTNSNANIYLVSQNTNIATITKTGILVAGNTTLATLTPSSLVMSDAGRNLQSVVLGTNLSFTGNTLNATGGTSLSGGTKGYVATWASSTALTIGTLLDNGTVSGVNATSSTTSFLVQGTGSNNPFRVNSSTGTSLLTVLQNGNLGIGQSSPVTKVEVSGGGLSINGSDEAISTSNSTTNPGSNVGMLQAEYDTTNNKGLIRSVLWGTQFEPLYMQANEFRWLTGAGTVTERMVLDANGALTLTNDTNASAVGPLIVKSNGLSNNIGTALTLDATASTGGKAYSFISTGNGAAGGTMPGRFAAYDSTDTRYVFTVDSLGQYVAGIFSTSLLSPAAQITSYPNSTSTVGLAIIGNSGQTANLLNITSSSTATAGNILSVTAAGNLGINTTTPGQALTVAGNIQLTGALFDKNNASGTLGMVLQTTGTGTQWVATSTLGIGASLSGGTNGYVARWTSTSALATSTILDNGIVSGVNATSSTVSFNIQGVPGSNDIFNLASSSGTSVLKVTSAGNITLGANANAAFWPLNITSIGKNLDGINAHVDIMDNTAVAQDVGGAIELGGYYTAFSQSNFAAIKSGKENSTSGNANGYLALFSSLGGTQAEHLRISANGNIGIGTITPTSSLFVQGVGSTTPFTIVSSTGSSLLTVLVNGNVGIGTSSPNNTLSIGSNLGASLFTSSSKVISIGNNSDISGIAMGQDPSNYGYLRWNYNATPANAYMAMQAFNGQAIVLAPFSGNVGIGSTSPTQTLSVAGSMVLTGSFLDRTGSAGSLGMVLQTTGGGTQWVATSTLGIGATASLSGGTNGYVTRWTSASAVSTGILLDNGAVAGVNATSATTSLFVKGSGTLNPFVVASSTGTNLLTILANGNVGIGQSNPQYSLHVTAASSNVASFESTGANNAVIILNSGTAGNQAQFSLSDAGTVKWQVGKQTDNSFFIYDNANSRNLLNTSGVNLILNPTVGNVSIGNPTANYPLSVTATNTNATILAQNPSASGYTQYAALNDQNNLSRGAYFGYAGTTAAAAVTGGPTGEQGFQGTSGSFPFVLYTNNTARMVLTAGGNVGIGTSSPLATLHVFGNQLVQTGTNTTTAFQVQNAAGAPVLLVDTTASNNLVTLGGFETGTTGWSATGTGASIARVTIHKWSGIAALQINTPATAGTGAQNTSFTSALQSSTKYTLSFYARVDSASSSFSTLQAGRADNGTTLTPCTLNSTTVQNNGWGRFTCTFTTGTVSGSPTIYIGKSDATARTFYIDGVQLQSGQNVTPYQVGNIQLRGVINSPVAISPISDSVSTFQIQDATGTANSFIVNTLNGRIGMGTSTTSQNVRLAVQGNTGSSDDLFDIATSTGASFFRVTANGKVGINTSTPSQALTVVGSVSNLIGSSANVQLVGSASVGASGYAEYVSGRYAYVVSNGNGTMSVVDLSNPAAPTKVSTTTVGTSAGGIYVAGRYAYVTNFGDNTISIVDISAPLAPKQIATTTVGTNPYGIAVSGKYAYVANNGSTNVSVVDVSNPYAPKQVATVSVGSFPEAIATYGRFVYVTNYGGSTVSIIDATNPLAPVLLPGTVSVGTNPSSIYISGKNAYVVNNGTSNMSILDISSSTAPSVVNTVNVGSGPQGVHVSGRYAYVANFSSNNISVLDISSSTAVSLVATVSAGSGPEAIFSSGRYVYVIGSAGAFSVLDVSGTETTSLITGGADVGNLQVRNDIIAQGQLQVTGGINVGIGGIMSNGALSINATSTPSYFGDQLSIGTTSTSSMVTLQAATGINPLSISSSSGASLLTILANGNVGIGSSVPNTIFDVVSNSLGGDLAIYQNTNANGYSDNGFWDNTGARKLYVGYGNLSAVAPFAGKNYLQNVNTDLEILGGAAGTTINTYFSSGGNVGIGTSGPASKLQVIGDIQLGYNGGNTSSALIFNTGSTANQTTVRLLATTTLASSYTLTLPTTTPVAGNAILTDANGNLYFGAAGGGLSGGTNGYLTRWTSPSTVSSGVTLDNGVVGGINATSSTTSFVVQGTGSLDPLTVNSSTGSSILKVTSAGIVNVGSANSVQGKISLFNSTNSFSTTLQASSTQGGNLTLILPGVAGAAGNCMISDGNNGLYYGACATGSGSIGGSTTNVIFNNGGASAGDSNFVWDNTNKTLGVGTATPITTARLVVVGSPTLDAFDIASTSGQSVLRVTSAGNIGIGTTTPRDTLEIAGNILLGMVPNATSATTTLIGTAGNFAGDLASGTGASVIFNGKLFISTVANNAAAVYRLDGSSWTRMTNAAGKVNVGDAVENDGYVMTVWNGGLYIGSQTGSGTGHAALWVSTNADTSNTPTWTQVNTTKGTFGATAAEDGVGDIAVWEGQIYFSTQKTNSAEVIEYLGGTNVGAGGFRTTSAAIGKLITTDVADMDDARLIVYNGRLYAGAITGGATARVEAWDGSAWILINTTRGTFQTGTINLGNVDAMTVYNGSLVVAVSTTTASAIVYRYDGSGGANANGFHMINNSSGKMVAADAKDINTVPVLKVYNGVLYAGTQGTAGTAAFYAYDPTNPATTSLWTMLNTSRGAFGSQSSVTAVGSMVDFNGTLYIGTQSATTADGVYTWNKNFDNSYGVRFDGGGSIGKISFVGNQQANDASGRSGSFLFTHGISMTSAAFDYAEDYPSIDTSLSAGDVVQIDPQNPGFVQKANHPGNFVGIVSANPGMELSLNKDNADSFYQPIALSGRVPVKISDENGPVLVGDYLTSSALYPGFATKAVNPGYTVGQALSAFDSAQTGSATGTVMAYVSISYFNGNQTSGPSSVIPTSIDPYNWDAVNNSVSLATLQSALANAKMQSNTLSKNILTNLSILGQNNIDGNTSLTSSYSDRIMAGLQVISPEVVTNHLLAQSISAISGSDLTINLSNGDGFKILSQGKTTSSPSTTLLSIDTLGNATFTGKVTAQEFSSPGLDLISTQVENLASTTLDLSNQITSLQDILGSFVSSASSSTSTALNVGSLTSGSLDISGLAVMNGGLQVDTIGSKGNILNIMSDTIFFGRPYFTTDTAGFAVVSKGQTQVNVTFDQAYLEQPIVNVNISINTSTATSTITNADIAQSIFSNDIRYLIINKSENGFTVVLNKAAPLDINFSWIALAVKNAKTFVLDPSQLVNTPADISTTTPEVLGTSTSTTEITPTPTTVDDGSNGSTATGDASTTIAAQPTPTAAPTVAPTATPKATPTLSPADSGNTESPAPSDTPQPTDTPAVSPT